MGHAKRRERTGRRQNTRVSRRVKVKPMDPAAMCGAGTSVTRLFKVEERLDQTRIHHLVFFDRHGWYCEHGKQCQAVKDVRKFAKYRT
ncbi:MAG TPA: hypothetical protein VFS56_07670 [Gemmatimonadaceae bacterium]|nr:hypothetical protein [Gemmatimonadaceae bacterium]